MDENKLSEGLLDSISDNAIMDQVKSGDLPRLGILYERYNRILFGYFYRLTCHAETSEDLVQNVFFRILKYRATFRNEGKFSTWMFHIAHNTTSDYFRKNKKSEYYVDPSELETHNIYDEEDLIKKERLRLLEKALHRLDHDMRELLILSRFKELKYREIAEILNCTEGAVKVRIYRAIRELRKIYSEMER